MFARCCVCVRKGLHTAGCRTAGYCLRVLLSEWCALWSGRAGAAAVFCLKVLLSEWCVRLGTDMLVPLLEGARCKVLAAWCCLRVLSKWCARFEAGWRCAAVTVVRALWSVGCSCQVLWSGRAAQRGVRPVCALEVVCRCRCRVSHGAASGCCCCERFGAGLLVRCCRVLPQGAAALWSWLAGAAAGTLKGAGAGHYCKRIVCILDTFAVKVRCAL